MGGAGKINGIVTDEDTGNVVEGANILAEHAEGYSWSIFTNASGYYTTTVAAGTYTITASGPGYQSDSVYPVEVAENGVTTQDFVLKYIPNVAITPDAQTKNGSPGTQVSYDLSVTNDAHVDQEITLSVESGWPVEAPTTTGLLGPEETVVVPVVVTIPMNPSIIIGTDVFTMTATGSVGGVAVATGTTNANVTPGVKVVGPGVDGSGSPNTVISYEFTITNTGNYTDSFALTLFGTWPDVLPGGNNTGPVATGASVKVVVLVTIPTGVNEGDKSVTILRATSDINHSTRATGRVTTWAERYRILMPLITR
jgi:hypothetical protein